MKKIWIEIQKGDETLFSRQYELDTIEYNCYFVKMVMRSILADLKGSGNVIISLLRKCLFMLIRIIANSRDMKDEPSATVTKDQIKISARLVDGVRFGK